MIAWSSPPARSDPAQIRQPAKAASEKLQRMRSDNFAMFMIANDERRMSNVEPFRVYLSGTGSSVPEGVQGMHRSNLEVVSQRPFGKPCASIASSE
jgi:hypothetical protein